MTGKRLRPTASGHAPPTPGGIAATGAPSPPGPAGLHDAAAAQLRTPHGQPAPADAHPRCWHAPLTADNSCCASSKAYDCCHLTATMVLTALAQSARILRLACSRHNTCLGHLQARPAACPSICLLNRRFVIGSNSRSLSRQTSCLQHCHPQPRHAGPPHQACLQTAPSCTPPVPSRGRRPSTWDAN